MPYLSAKKSKALITPCGEAAEGFTQKIAILRISLSPLPSESGICTYRLVEELLKKHSQSLVDLKK